MFISNNPGFFNRIIRIWDNNERGITLIEIMFSVVILSLVITGILLVFVQTVDLGKRINFDYAATNIAKSRIERARSVIETSSFSALTNTTFGESDVRVDSSGGSVVNGDFKRTTLVTTSHDSNARLTRVEVEVEYLYVGTWREDAVVKMATVFANIE